MNSIIHVDNEQKKKEIINRYNFECKRLLFYCNSQIASILNQRIINKNAQINEIKNEFNRQILLLRQNLFVNDAISANDTISANDAISANDTISANTNKDVLSNEKKSIHFVCSQIQNNIMLTITSKN